MITDGGDRKAIVGIRNHQITGGRGVAAGHNVAIFSAVSFEGQIAFTGGFGSLGHSTDAQQRQTHNK